MRPRINDFGYYTKAAVKYILNHAVKKHPIKPSEISKHALRNENVIIEEIFDEVKALLWDVSINDFELKKNL